LYTAKFFAVHRPNHELTHPSLHDALPIFSNIVIGDEINRASPKTQSALLECMEEGQTTVDGATHQLPSPFLVVATQNPVEMEGACPLPEAQRDRFMARLTAGYPDAEAELRMLRTQEAGHPLGHLRPQTPSCGSPRSRGRSTRPPPSSGTPSRSSPRRASTPACGSAPRPARRSSSCAPPRRSPRCPGATTCSRTTSSTSPCPCSRTASSPRPRPASRARTPRPSSRRSWLRRRSPPRDRES